MVSETRSTESRFDIWAAQWSRHFTVIKHDTGRDSRRISNNYGQPFSYFNTQLQISVFKYRYLQLK